MVNVGRIMINRRKFSPLFLVPLFLATGVLFSVFQSVNAADTGETFKSIMEAIEKEDSEGTYEESVEQYVERERKRPGAREHALEEELRLKALKDELKDKIVMEKWEIGNDLPLGYGVATDWTTRAEVDLPGGSKIHADADTGLKLEASRDKIIFSISKGKIRALIQPKTKFEIKGHLSSGGVRGTEFVVEEFAGTTTYQVLSGTVEVTGFLEEKTVLVPAGYKVTQDFYGKLGDLQAFNESSVDRWWETTPWDTESVDKTSVDRWRGTTPSQESTKTTERPFLFSPTSIAAGAAAVALLFGLVFFLIKRRKR